MLKNYFKTAFRNLVRNKTYSLINLLGLSIGITCAALLYLYVQDELNYDKHHSNADRIYRYTSEWRFKGNESRDANTSGKLASGLKQQFPEIEQALRVQKKGEQMLEYNKKYVSIRDLHYVDSTYFKLFDHKFIEGSPVVALYNPNQVVLTQSTAKKIFGTSKNAVGKTIKLNSRHEIIVSGVIEDITENTHLPANGFISIATLDKDEAILDKWNSYGNCTTYLLLSQGTAASQLEEKITKWYRKHIVLDLWKEPTMVDIAYLQPLSDIHLKSQYMDGEKYRGDIKQVNAAILVALFVLLIAAINYINLATSRSMHRAKEVGIRKVMGSYRKQLIGQFLAESFLVVLMAIVFSLSLVEMLLPAFNKLAHKELFMSYGSLGFWVLLGLLIVGMGLLSGFYPAFILSSFKPVQVLKGKMIRQKGSVRLRKSLVVFQFSISIVFIISTLVVYQQLSFMRNQNLGFTKERVIDFYLPKSLRQKVPEIKQAFLRNANIPIATATSTAIGRNDNSTSTVGFNVNNGRKEIQTQWVSVDEDYLKTLQLKMKKGRWFSKKYKSDKKRYVVINETLAKRIGAKNVLGLDAYWKENEKPYKVLGVVKDFHLRSLHVAVNPMIIFLQDQNDFRHLYLKVNGKHLKSAMNFAKDVHEKYEKKHAFNASFLDQYFDQQYRRDERQGNIFMIFSGMAIFIACLGLLGLAAFTVQQRTKEMGIRKVLGASASNIIWLIAKNFLLLIGIASVFAFPVAYFTMKNWLQSFAYQTSIHWSIFVVVSFAAVAIAMLTIGWQTFKATTVNPVKVLKDE